MASLAPSAGMISVAGSSLDAEAARVEAGHGLAERGAPPVGGVLVGVRPRHLLAASPAPPGRASGVSGSPMPSEMMSTPAGPLGGDLALDLGEQVRGEPAQALGPDGPRAQSASSARDELRRELAPRRSPPPVRSSSPPGRRPRRSRRSPPARCTVTGLVRPPSRTPATAAAQAPVPQASVSPTPRSQTRISELATGPRAARTPRWCAPGSAGPTSISGPSRAHHVGRVPRAR